MHRIDADAHVSNLFSDGDPGIGQPGTRVDAAWANAVQEELCNLIEGMGLTLVKGTNTQLLAAFLSVAPAPTVIAPALEADWTSGGSGRPPIGYWMDRDRRVNLKGSATASGGAGVTIFTLPVGFRPLEDLYFGAWDSVAGAPVACLVMANGEVRVSAPAAAHAYFLESIYFLAEQ